MISTSGYSRDRHRVCKRFPENNISLLISLFLNIKWICSHKRYQLGNIIFKRFFSLPSTLSKNIFKLNYRICQCLHSLFLETSKVLFSTTVKTLVQQKHENDVREEKKMYDHVKRKFFYRDFNALYLQRRNALIHCHFFLKKNLY